MSAALAMAPFPSAPPVPRDISRVALLGPASKAKSAAAPLPSGWYRGYPFAVSGYSKCCIGAAAPRCQFAHPGAARDNYAMRDFQRVSTVALAALFLAALTVLSFAKDKTLPLPRAFHAKTYPANDVHTDEKVAIAADPYDTADKAATAF